MSRDGMLKFLDANGNPVYVSPDNPLPIAGGGAGGDDMEFLSGTSDPTPDIGDDGDVFLNTSSGDLFKREGGSWNLLMNLVGPQGPQGPQGAQGPDGSDGADGRGVADITFDGDTNELVFAMTDTTEIRIPWPSP